MGVFVSLNSGISDSKSSFQYFQAKMEMKHSRSSLKRKTYLMTAWNKTKRNLALYFTFPTSSWPLPFINGRWFLFTITSSSHQPNLFNTAIIFVGYFGVFFNFSSANAVLWYVLVTGGTDFLSFYSIFLTIHQKIFYVKQNSGNLKENTFEHSYLMSMVVFLTNMCC